MKNQIFFADQFKNTWQEEDSMRPALIQVLLLAALLLAGMAHSAPDSHRVVQASEILAMIERGEDVEYDGVIVEGDLELSGLDLPKEHVERNDDEVEVMDSGEGSKLINSSIRIVESEIRGTVNLSNMILLGPVDFNFTNFSGPIDICGCQFENDTGFVASQFNGYALFVNANFDDNISFIESQFNYYAVFWSARFDQNVSFLNSQFGDDVSFMDARFCESAEFAETKFSGSASFKNASFNKTADFKGAQFSDNVYFRESEFNKTANFEWVQFEKDSSFRDSNFEGTAIFNESQFTGNALFEGAVFNNTLFLKRARFNKLYIRWDSISNKLAYDDEIYLLLIDNYKKLGLYADADNCYYYYRKELCRNLSIYHKPIDYFLMFLYGYGVKPVRPLLASSIVILLFGLAFWFMGGITLAEADESGKKDPRRVSPIGTLLFSSTVFLSGTKLFIDPPKYRIRSRRSTHRITAFKCMFTLERVLGMILFFMFLITIGNTLIR